MTIEGRNFLEESTVRVRIGEISGEALDDHERDLLVERDLGRDRWREFLDGETNYRRDSFRDFWTSNDDLQKKSQVVLISPLFGKGSRRRSKEEEKEKEKEDRIRHLTFYLFRLKILLFLFPCYWSTLRFADNSQVHDESRSPRRRSSK